MRVVKDAQERRNEILDAAEELFVTRGYDHTSTNDILEKVGIARGTLYYHFSSKEEILNAMIDRINESLIARAERVAKDLSVPVVDRIVMTIASFKVNSEIGNEIIEQVHKPQNALLHQKMQQSLLTGVVPILTKLVREGIDQGIFHLEYPEETVEMLILYSIIAFDELEEGSEARSTEKIQAFLCNTERLLGAKEGSVRGAMLKLFSGQPAKKQ